MTVCQTVLPADELCRDFLAIHRESCGRTVENAEAHVLSDTEPRFMAEIFRLEPR